MQNFKSLRQPLLGELAMSRKKEEERKKERKKKNSIYSGHLCFCLPPRPAHALCSDQYLSWLAAQQRPELPWTMFRYSILLYNYFQPISLSSRFKNTYIDPFFTTLGLCRTQCKSATSHQSVNTFP